MMNLPEYMNAVNDIMNIHHKKVQEATREMDIALQTAHDEFFGTLIPGDKEIDDDMKQTNDAPVVDPSRHGMYPGHKSTARDQEWRRL